MVRRRLLSAAAVAAAVLILAGTGTGVAASRCPPTPPDELGPFYRPGAPLRVKIGSGYVLSGTVRSAGSCQPLPGARVEFWQVNRAGVYDDPHRAAVITDKAGRYRLETEFPPPYVGRPSHIHIRVSVPGSRELVTQHYPKKGEQGATFDLVLEPE